MLITGKPENMNDHNVTPTHQKATIEQHFP